MPYIFIQLSAILGIALAVSFVVKQLRQPLVIGYILTGIIVGPMFLGLLHPTDAIESFGQLGVALLLFIVGLSLKPEMIRDVGRPAIITGLGQIIFTTIFGFALATALHFDLVAALYLAVAFTFSSTIIVLQLLYDKEEQDTLYGRIAIGFLLVQDGAALLLFLFLTSTSAAAGSFYEFTALMLLKILTIVIAGYILSRQLMPRIDIAFARSREVLFLFALATALSLATLFRALGFSFELGALAAGVILSSSPYQREIAARLGTLRDFFLIMFFVVLGTSVSFDIISGSWFAIIIFSLFILIGNPLVVIILMRHLGYTLEAGFYAGLTVAQISEFSLILLTLGVRLNHLDASIVGFATVVGLVTIFVSSYFMINNRRLFKFMEPRLRRILNDNGGGLSKTLPRRGCQVILFGCHRLGTGIVSVLKELNLTYLVVDHDPDIIKSLNSDNIQCVFGAADDFGFLDTLPIAQCRTIISTIPETAVNEALTEYVRRHNQEAIILCIANHHHQAASLYAAGATYVIVPPYLGRRYLIELLREYGLNEHGYLTERRLHENELRYIENGGNLSSTFST